MRSPDEIVEASGAEALAVSLAALTPRDRALAGGKAANLGAMIRAGLPVPGGYCVLTPAYQVWLAGCPAAGPALDRLDRLQLTQVNEVREAAAAARHALAAAPVPESVGRAILAEWERHGPANGWAVRSSATLEDLPNASFAGQHDSVLGVVEPEALLGAVRRCWLSLFSERAIAYRLKKGIAQRAAAMAVIVQKMAPAKAAGVLFTVDPVSGNGGRMIIEGTFGLGDRLVSGQVKPERVVLDKETLRVIEHDASPEHRCLAEGQAKRLGKLARQVERLFGGPQDIEWAVTNGQVFLLQARPVTTTRPAKTWADRQVWTNLNTGEVFPDPATPATWSMLQCLINPIFRSIFRLFGADVSRGPAAGLVAGRIYFNVNTSLAALRPFGLAQDRVSEVAQALGGGAVEDYRQLGLTIPVEDLPDLGFHWGQYLLSWPGLVVTLIRHSPRRGETFLREVQARGARLAGLDFSSLSTAELARTFPRTLRENLEGWDLLYLFTRAGALLVFGKVCRDWLGDRDHTIANQLFAALGGFPETEAGLALWRLAAQAHTDPATDALLRSDQRWDEVRPQLAQSRSDHPFLVAWDGFMAEHGHHCRGELELGNARWAEEPDYILSVVRNYHRSLNRSDPLEQQRRLVAQRLQLTEACRRRLRNPLKRWLFSWSVARVQQLALDRELWKNAVVRHIAVLRRLLLLLGDRLQRDGVLAQRDDIFFLEIDEVEPVGTGGATFDVRKVVADRRTEYERNQGLHPPAFVRGRYDPATHAVRAVDPNLRVLSGLPVFPGVAKGRARLILRAEVHQHVEPGEILVAPFTDPAWTPYFIPAAGVVVEQGGLLSHGSIIAREYGLPSVTNVSSATQVFRTGDVIEVDGGRGLVSLLERANGRP